jgi:Skp family chaperone for outer membrane proteins
MIAQSPKIGVVDLDTVFTNSNLYQWAEEQVQQCHTAATEMIQAEQTLIKLHQEKITQMSCGYIPSIHNRMVRELKSRQFALSKMAITAENSLNQVEKELLNIIYNALEQSVDSIEHQLQYDLIFDKKAVIFDAQTTKTQLLTQNIIVVFNQRYNKASWNQLTTPIINEMIQKVSTQKYISLEKRAEILRSIEGFPLLLLRPFHY